MYNGQVETQLLIYSVGYGLSAALSVILGFFVWIRDPKKISNILYLLTILTFSTFIGSFILGINTSDEYQSRFYLLFTMANILTVTFNAHLAFAMFNKVKEQIVGLVTVYIGAASLLIFFITDINRYVLPSKQYQFFVNFYNRGEFYWLFATFFIVVSCYFFTVIALTSFKGDKATKRRAYYFMLAFGWAYLFGSVLFLPIFGINIDSTISMLMGLYTIPLAYGILKYDLLDLHILTRNAFIYAIGIAFVGLTIIGINILNNVLITTFEGFPVWIIPFISALIVMMVGMYVWNQLRQADALKYEFINNISHKFRTPLTHIRWIAEELRTEPTLEERNKYVNQIQYASMRLFELTNIVMDVAKNEVDDNFYSLTPLSVTDIFETIRQNHVDQIERKHLKIEIISNPDTPTIEADKTRLEIALQILYENAIIYTPENGKITISIQKHDHDLYIIMKDSGIGIDTAEIPYMFSKFYRTRNARHTDTEGMGIGLYIAKNIIEKHHGKMWVESDGLNKGSTFSIQLPLKASVFQSK